MSKKAKKVKKASKVKAQKAPVEIAKKKITQRIDNINRVVNRLEGEVEGLFKKIVKKGERSRRELRRSFDDLFSWLKKGDLLALATETRDDVEREVRRLADDVIQSVKEIELLPTRANFTEVFQSARKNLGSLVENLGDNDLVQRAKSTLNQTKKDLLSLLSIPTQDEVVKLERKIVSLEKRLSTLSRKAA
jgi:Mg2+ and Co2+ transporter CorA